MIGTLAIGSIASSIKILPGGGPVSSDIVFNNPNPYYKIWYSGQLRTGTIDRITGYNNVYWEIINVRTRAVVLTGTTFTVSHTFTFVSLDNCNVYDLRVINHNGIWGYERLFAMEFKCYPPVPTTPNVTWSTAGYRNGVWATNRPGYAIQLSGTITGTVDMDEYNSDDPTNPVYVYGSGVTINTNSYGLKCRSHKNIIYNFGVNESVPYGLEINRISDTGVNQLFFFEWNGNGATIDQFSKNVIICGIKCDGGGFANTTGTTAFRLIPGGRNATVNSNTRQLTGVHMFHCKGVNTWEETFYLGYFTDAKDGSGYSHSYIDGAIFDDLVGEGSGNDLFQLLAFNTYVANCTFIESGTRNNSSHESSIQLSNGCRNVSFFRNKVVESPDASNLFYYNSGLYGGNCEIFANLFYSPVGPGDAGNIWGKVELSDLYPDVFYNFFDNTIVCAAGTSAFTAYEAFATNFNKLLIKNNIILSDTGQDYINASGVSAANVDYANNYEHLYANIGTLGFVNPGTDFRLNSLSAAPFTSRVTVPSSNPYAGYDFSGYRYKPDYPVLGAFVSQQLHYNQGLVSVGGADQVINGNTYNVHSAELPHSIKRRAANVFRFEVNQGECRASESGIERSELSYGSGSAMAYGTNIWTAYSFQVAAGSNWDVPANVCGQFHAGVGSPNLSIRLNKHDELKVVVRAGLSSSYTETVPYTDVAFVPGQWYDIVINSVFSPGTATGTIKVWINGVQVVNLTSYITGYSDASSTYFKFGMYRSTSAPENAVVYYANVETGTTDLTDRITNPLPVL